MTQRVLRKPHHVDDVRCALSLLGHFLNFPEVIHTIDDTVYRSDTLGTQKRGSKGHIPEWSRPFSTNKRISRIRQ